MSNNLQINKLSRLDEYIAYEFGEIAYRNILKKEEKEKRTMLMTDLEKIKTLFDDIGIEYDYQNDTNIADKDFKKSISVKSKHMHSYGICVFDFNEDEKFTGIEAE